MDFLCFSLCCNLQVNSMMTAMHHIMGSQVSILSPLCGCVWDSGTMSILQQSQCIICSLVVHMLYSVINISLQQNRPYSGETESTRYSTQQKSRFYKSDKVRCLQWPGWENTVSGKMNSLCVILTLLSPMVRFRVVSYDPQIINHSKVAWSRSVLPQSHLNHRF